MSIAEATTAEVASAETCTGPIGFQAPLSWLNSVRPRLLDLSVSGMLSDPRLPANSFRGE
jgi:hypothetical protein